MLIQEASDEMKNTHSPIPWEGRSGWDAIVIPVGVFAAAF